MKLIFLDIDGVLNYEGYGRFTSAGTRFIDPVLVKRLKKIIDATGAKVVFSSTWRKGFYDICSGYNDTVDARDYSELVAELEKYGVEIFGVTPLCGDIMRGEEIQRFIEQWQGEKIERFVILDDIPIMYPYQSRLVCTDYFFGISEDDVESAVHLLGSLSIAKSSGATVIIEECIEYLSDEYFFDDKTIEKVFLPNSIKGIGKRAFALCDNLKQVYFPNKSIALGKEVFKGCSSLERIALPSEIAAFGAELFADCTALKNVILPERLRYVPYGTFFNCTSLESIDLPENVELMGNNIFYGCTALREVTVPPKVKRIEGLTFYGCTSLKRIYVGVELKNLKRSALMNCPSLEEIIIY